MSLTRNWCRPPRAHTALTTRKRAIEGGRTRVHCSRTAQHKQDDEDPHHDGAVQPGQHQHAHNHADL
jgi:hypothetical protein